MNDENKSKKITIMVLPFIFMLVCVFAVYTSKTLSSKGTYSAGADDCDGVWDPVAETCSTPGASSSSAPASSSTSDSSLVCCEDSYSLTYKWTTRDKCYTDGGLYNIVNDSLCQSASSSSTSSGTCWCNWCDSFGGNVASKDTSKTQATCTGTCDSGSGFVGRYSWNNKIDMCYGTSPTPAGECTGGAEKLTASFTFHNTSGQWVSNKSCKYCPDSSCTVSPSAGIYAGYTFVGWSTSSSCSSPVKTTSFSSSSSTKEYWACWKADTADEPMTVTLTFKSNNGNTTLATRSCTIEANKDRCSEDLVAPSANIPTISGKEFNGWGESVGCKAGSYTANATFTITRSSKNKTYYACYTDATPTQAGNTFDANKCTYSSLTKVTRDERYLNCKYTNISYNNDPNNNTGDSKANIKACCLHKGYTWVDTNFTSSGFGNEYCIICESVTAAPTTKKPTNVPVTNTPDTPVTNNPTTKKPTTGAPSSYACYVVDGEYKWLSSRPANGTLVQDITSSGDCHPVNPQTGTFGVIIAWIVGLGAVGYATYYFKSLFANKEE